MALILNQGRVRTLSSFPLIFLLCMALSFAINRSVGPKLKFYVFLDFAIFIFSFLIDRTILPSLAMIFLSFCPIPYLTTLGIFQLLSPASLVLLVFVLKNLNSIVPMRILFVSPLILVLIYLGANSDNVQRSLGWSYTLSLLLVSITLNFQSKLVNYKFLIDTLFAISIVLIIYAILEVIIGSNPIFNNYPLYWGRYSSWGQYRITTSLGHPINNGLYFSFYFLLLATLPLAENRKRIRISILFLLFICTLLSGSRSGVLALFIGIAVLAIYNYLNGIRSRRVAIWLPFLPILLLILFPAYSKFLSRNVSFEGKQSAAYRFKVITDIWQQLPYIPAEGFGPGLGSAGFRTIGFRTILESGIGQLLVGLGVTLTLLIVFITLTSLIRLSLNKKSKVHLYVPWAVVFFTTNFINDNLPFIVFLAVLILLERTLAKV